MNIDLDHASIKLQAGATLQVTGARNTTLLVTWGQLWVTQENDPSDYVLGPGESFTITSTGLILAYALEEALITVLDRVRVPPPDRIGIEQAARHASIALLAQYLRGAGRWARTALRRIAERLRSHTPIPQAVAFAQKERKVEATDRHPRRRRTAAHQAVELPGAIRIAHGRQDQARTG